MKNDKKSKFLFWLPLLVSVAALTLSVMAVRRVSHVVHARGQHLAQKQREAGKPAPSHGQQRREMPKKEG